MQAQTSIRVPDTFMTLPLACLLSAASAHPPISTGKERDAESGNDYFPARYYASSMGRFMSPDPSGLVFADPSNPQSLNLYSYVRNNPLLLVDPTGLFCYQVNSSTVTIDNKAQNAGQCAKGATWIDGTATNYSYGTDGVLQVGFSQAGGTGTLSFSSSDLSTDSSGNIQNPWGIGLSDTNKYGGGQLGQYGGLNRYKSRLFGMHWCGPGGGGPPTSANDAACRQHDADYAAAGASADMNTGKATPTPDQIKAMAAANQKMLNAVLKNPGEVSTPFLELWLTGGVGNIYPWTEAHYPDVQLSSPQAPSTNFGQWSGVP